MQKMEQKIDLNKELILKINQNSTNEQNNLIDFSEKQIVELLDNCYKILQSVEVNSIAYQLINTQIDNILNNAQIEVIAKLNQDYDSKISIVIDSKYQGDLAQGTIISIIEQGYIYKTKELIKKAKIIVSTTNQI